MLRVLLLEDDEFDAQLVQRELRAGHLPFDLIHAKDASTYFANLDQSFDLILSDYRVPGLDEGEALRAAKELTPTTPFILLSGALPEEAVADLLKAGATDFVNKERLERLPFAIRRAIDESQGRTELVRMQSDLVAAKEAADLANLAKDRFIATLSHELRTPLTPVLLTLELALGFEDLSEEMTVALRSMQRNLELEVGLINDLLDLTAISSGKMRLKLGQVDFRSLLDGAIGVCHADAEAKSIELDVQSVDAPVLVDVDSRRTQQAIWNILRNAIKFTERGQRIAVRLQANAGALTLSITDTGIGIDPSQLGAIFSPFQQATNSRRGGLGLGLAIAREIIDLQGGSLVAFSEGEGTGSTFTITLPVSAREVATTSATLRAPVAGTTTALRVCVVEDHADTRHIIREHLLRRGYAIDLAGDLQEARALLSERPYDLLISDIGLPDGSGYDLRRELDADRLKSIALTGYGQEADVARSLDAGFDRQLTKPIELDVLLTTIDGLFAPDLAPDLSSEARVL